MTDIRNRARILSLRATRAGFAAAFSLILLAGCTTTQKSADSTDPATAAPKTGTAIDAKGILAKGGATAANRYRDPMVSTGQRQMQAGNNSAIPEQAQISAPQSEGAVQQPSASIAGLATQPTGVRAGSFSIFASSATPSPVQASASAAEDASASALVQETAAAPAAPGRVSAATMSVFSANRSAPACSTDAAGNLSC